LQPWQNALDLGHQGTVLSNFKSFGFQDQRGIQKQRHSKDPYEYCHSGFAWACTRKFWENLPRGLMDFCLLGSADWHMAWACIGDVDATLYTGIGPIYNEKCREWQGGAVKTSRREVGFVPTRIEHWFHGPKGRRYYKERNKILIDCKYDPIKNLMYDEQGVIHIVNNDCLEKAIRKYNRSRFEDSIEEI